jgi:hypothetical protein
MDDQQKNTLLFTQLVIMFHSAAMQQLGKIKNPMSGAVERNLEAAQSTIDLLGMLNAKTRGNLSAEEERLIHQVLQELRLNYVDEAAKPAPEPSKEPQDDVRDHRES